jgi:hypothetical protein
MRRYYPVLLAGVALVAIACADATAPSFETVRARAFSAGVFDERKEKSVEIPQGAAVPFTIPVAGGSVDIGDYRVTFDANSLCHPSSGYGKRFWDKPCASYGRDSTIQAAFWVEDNGDVYVEFLAELRFDPAKFVFISIEDPRLKQNGTASPKEIMYWTRTKKGRSRINEGADDATLKSFLEQGRLARRVKHFSGYMVAAGRCNEGDPECGENGGQ